MTDLFPVTREEMIREVEREIALRKRVYPAWVGQRRLTQDKADRQIQVMEAIAALLQQSPKAQTADQADGSPKGKDDGITEVQPV